MSGAHLEGCFISLYVLGPYATILHWCSHCPGHSSPDISRVHALSSFTSLLKPHLLMRLPLTLYLYHNLVPQLPHSQLLTLFSFLPVHLWTLSNILHNLLVHMFII